MGNGHINGTTVFVSYAHADNQSDDPARRWLDRLLQHLKPLQFQDIIAVASDRDIDLGDDWHATIQDALVRAGAAVLLVSPNFLASHYIRNNELPVLLRQAKERGLKIIPVLLRPCLFDETRFKFPDPKQGPEEFTLSSLQAAGSPGKALNEMNEGEQDRALLSVAQTLLKYAKQGAIRGPIVESLHPHLCNDMPNFHTQLGDPSHPGRQLPHTRHFKRGDNPYVTGHELPPDSPVFFGREAMLHTIRASLLSPAKPQSVSLLGSGAAASLRC